ncbi:hypothetical protein [Verrucomicrobium spinosum]|uniref:hypothetical protein n=1 Tax=Verrucomicrobium spinosum TaxID=2736 RepID=UPI000174687F|nr:hypothetical protein [Verrucomicrobium spinosum]
MNSAIEQGLRAYLTEKFGAVDTLIGEGVGAVTLLACVIEGATVSLHCNVGKDVLPDSVPYVIVGIKDVQHRVGELYDGEVLIAVSTPDNVAGVSEVQHRAVVKALRQCWPDMQRLYADRARAVSAEDIAATQAALDAGLANTAAISAALEAAAGVSTAGYFFQGVGESLGNNRWQAQIRIKLGLREV